MLLNARKNKIYMIDEVVNPCQKGTQLLQGISYVQACDWKKIFKLTAEHKKAYFSHTAQQKR